MSPQDLGQRASRLLLQLGEDERAGVERVVVLDEPSPSLFPAFSGPPAEVRDDLPEPVIALSAQTLTGADEAEILAALVFALERYHEDLALREEIPNEQALFEQHAALRRGDATWPGWYRRGEQIAQGLWAVDLDLFAELVVPARQLAELGGQSVVIRLDDEEIDIELPDQPKGDDLWTLEGLGLIEEDPDAVLPDDEDEVEFNDDGEGPPLPGRSGDFYVVPCTYGDLE